MQDPMSKSDVRVSQRAPQRCLECSRRRIRCSKDLPCHACVERGIPHLCRREIVIVQGKVTNLDETKKSEDADMDLSNASVAPEQVSQLMLETQKLEDVLRQYNARFGLLEKMEHCTEARLVNDVNDVNDDSISIPSRLLSSNDSPEPSYFSSISQARYKRDPGFQQLSPDHLRSLMRSGSSSSSPSTPAIRLDLMGLNSEALSINAIVGVARDLPASFTTFAELLDDHVSVVAVTEGWNAIEKQIDLDPQWQILKIIDQRHLIKYRQGDRLAAIRVFRIAMKYYAAQDKSNPALKEYMLDYLRPTPSQLSIEHPHVINYVAWPKLRERLIFNQAQFFNEPFYDVFMAATRFRWEDSVQSAFFRNPTTSMLQLNNDFIARLDDGDSWTLKNDFFDAYPEFEGDAPRYEVAPGGVRPSQRLLMRKMLEEAWLPKRKKKRAKCGTI